MRERDPMILLALIPLLPGAALFAVFAIREGNRTHRTNSEQD